MRPDETVWRPWSFTKNFSWGETDGLQQLHASIRVGFDNKLEDVPRDLFRERISILNRPDLIPINFFLFNEKRTKNDYIVVDELVFQALISNHSARFDKLALFDFNFSYAGNFKSSMTGQRRPALWAHYYIRDRVAKKLGWDVQQVNADDIKRFISNDTRWRAKDATKVATNLAHFYKVGHLADFAVDRVERWWVDALFLALDRLIGDAKLDGKTPNETEYADFLASSGFHDVSGKRSLEKQLATGHLIRLYEACGGRDRFSKQAAKERTALKVADVEAWIAPNDDAPRGAVHPTNPRILKSIPQTCAMLAIYAGFEVISFWEMADFDEEAFVKRRTREAIDRLKAEGVTPIMSAEDVFKLTRER